MREQPGQRCSVIEQPKQQQRDCGPKNDHSGVEEISKKEAAVEEKGEKQGAAERNHDVLTPNPYTTHCLTKGTEYNLWRQQEGRRCDWSAVEPGKGEGKMF